MKEQMLPIGTIVKLTDTEHSFMIAGYFPKGAPTPDHIYDYAGFYFPLGYTGTLDVFQFDHKQVEEVIALGYQDKEQLEFMENIINNYRVIGD